MDVEFDPPEPIYGFVSRRKKFFASLENITDPEACYAKKPPKGKDTSGKKYKDTGSKGQLTKWQSLPMLDQPSTNDEIVEVSKEYQTNGEEHYENEVYTNGIEEGVKKKSGRPHWTVLFQQRLSQIRHKFESRCRSEQTKGGSSSGNSGWKTMKHQGSMNSLLAGGQNGHNEVAKSCSDLYLASTMGRPMKTRPYQGKKVERSFFAPSKVGSQVELRLKKVGPGIQAHLEAMLAQQSTYTPNNGVTLHEEIPDKDVYMDHRKWFSEGHPPPEVMYEQSNGWFAGTDAKWGSNSGFVSPVPPALESTEGFTADDKIKSRTTLLGWDPVKLLQDLYEVRLMPDNQANCQPYINMEGYMEKLPLNKKKATLLKTWKRRYFKAKEGCLYYYEDQFSPAPEQEEYETWDNTTERSSGIVQLGGGNVEALDDRIIGIDDGRGHYLTLRCSSDEDMDRWMEALTSQTLEDVAPTWVQPVLHSHPSSKRKVVVVDIGSCSVRAGILGEKPSLPQLFFPSIIASGKSGEKIFGFDALKPDIRSSHLLSYLVRPAFRLDKTTFDMNAVEPLFTKIFSDLQINPSEYWLMFSSPGNFCDEVKLQFMDLFVNKFKLRGANIVSQTLLSLYSYQTSTGVFVNIGECLEIVPVTDGYVVDGGASRQPYGGHRVAEFLNTSFTESRYRFFTDVEFQIVRLAVERSCYVALDFKEEQKRCMADPAPFRKTIDLQAYDLPQGTWQNVTHDLSRFKSSEGLFDTSHWEMDNPPLTKLIQNAVLASPMDTRREMWRNICLSGGVTQLPGFAERLKAELTKMVPSSVRVQIRTSPHRYHSAYIGACTMAGFSTWEQSGISADEWKKQGVKALRKWHIN